MLAGAVLLDRGLCIFTGDKGRRAYRGKESFGSLLSSDSLALGAAQAPMTGARLRQPCGWQHVGAGIAALVALLCLGSSPAQCQTGGFGSPAPAPGQCNNNGPRVDCGEHTSLYLICFSGVPGAQRRCMSSETLLHASSVHGTWMDA